VKITANHKIFVFDNYPRQDLLLKDLGDYFENHKDCQNRQTNVKATMTEWNLDLPSQEFIHLKNTIYTVAKDQHFYWGVPFKIESIWANIYRKGDCTVSHDHDPSRYSFVYFLKSKPNFSPLMFESINLKNKKKKWKVVKPTEGRLVIFPGFLTHLVPVHIHDETRITISGNFS
jgi:uncharacterized protein (TIGR02466 family)